MNPNPKCPMCNSSPYLHAICQKNNPIWFCFYALIGRVHSHHWCANRACNAYWIGF